MKKAFAIAGLGLLSTFGFAQTRTPAPEALHHERKPDDPFRLKALSGNVHALHGRGGTVGFFVGPDYVIVVDSQFKDLAPGIVEQIQKVTDRPIQYLVNTHHHGDHVGGNEVFKQFARIVAHDNVRKRMLASPAAILRDFPARIEEAKKAGNEQMVKTLQEQIEWAKKVKVEEIAAPFLTSIRSSASTSPARRSMSGTRRRRTRTGTASSISRTRRSCTWETSSSTR